MTVILNNVKLPLQADESSLGLIAAGTLGIRQDEMLSLRLVRMALDARKKQDIHHSCTLRLELEPAMEECLVKKGLVIRAAPREPQPQPGETPLPAPIVVAGLGPAGLFAAYTLARFGYRPLVLERGRPVEQRSLDVQRFWDGGGLDENSNIMFGEGGAGTFSDGKLTTRIKDARAQDVIDILAKFGAPEQIKVLAKPHVGTDNLTKTVGALRRETERLGGQVRFETRLTGLKTRDGGLVGVEVQSGGKTETLPCCACILGIGQGARDTYRMLLASGVQLSPKPFAVGVRVEHPREFIDRSQFGSFAGNPRLGAAEYRLSAQCGGRGVYTFCMCPGGEVIGSSSAQGEVVVNGMSSFARDAENSNAAVVVQVGPEDFGSSPLAGMEFQQRLEQEAYRLGGGDFLAPAERIGDYTLGHGGTGFGGVTPSYRPGVKACNLKKCLPDFVAGGISEGLRAFGRQLKGFDMPDAVLTAVESRTSSPVRIMRDGEGQANIRGLYPVGEGAGYAGGIVSAAVDGMRAAERLVRLYKV